MKKILALTAASLCSAPAMAGPDYIGDKLRYGQLDRILNPLGDFRKPTLDQLRIHKANYPIKV